MVSKAVFLALFSEGDEQSIFIQANLTSIVWDNEYLNDDSNAFKSLSGHVSNKVSLSLSKNMLPSSFLAKHAHWQDFL